MHHDLHEGRHAELIHWMPAHTRHASAGEVRCSNGIVLNESKRCANAIVDQLAKSAAQSIAISLDMRAGLKVRYDPARELAIFVGRITYAAGLCLRDGKARQDSAGPEIALARRRQEPRAST